MPIKKLPPLGKEYFCFQIDGKSYHAVHCAKSRVSIKVIDTILEIDSFDQQCVISKGLLHKERLKQHMVLASHFLEISGEFLHFRHISAILDWKRE